MEACTIAKESEKRGASHHKKRGRDQTQRRAREVAWAGTPHPLWPPRAHMRMDAITLPSVLAASSPPTKARARRLLLHGRDCRRPWLWSLPVRLCPGDGAAHRRCSAHGGRAAGGRMGG